MSCSAAALLTYIIPLHRQSGRALGGQSAARCGPFQSSLHRSKQSLQPQRVTVCVAAAEVRPDRHPRLCEHTPTQNERLEFHTVAPCLSPLGQNNPDVLPTSA